MSESLNSKISEILENSAEFNLLMQNIFRDEDITIEIKIKRDKSKIENSVESVFTNIVQERLVNKAVPLVLRKRLMYEQAMQNNVLQKVQNVV